MPSRARRIRAFIPILIVASLCAPLSAHALTDPWADGWGPPGGNGGPGSTEFGAFSHPSWLAVRFSVPVSTSVTWKIRGDFADSTSAGLGLWVMRGTSVIDNTFSVHRDRYPNVLYAQASALGVTLNPLNASSGGGAGGRDLELTDTLSPGTYTAVAVAVSDASMSGRVTLSSVGSMQPIADGSGPNVFLRDERSFTGLANVYVQQAYVVRLKAIAQAARTESIGHNFFGWFGSVSDPTSLMHSDGPDGHRDGLQQYVYAGAPAGTYTMTIDVDAGGPGSATGAFGADVTLP